jgi:hypothetical protein
MPLRYNFFEQIDYIIIKQEIIPDREIFSVG